LPIVIQIHFANKVAIKLAILSFIISLHIYKMAIFDPGRSR